MKVYSVIKSVDYEGDDLLAVFASREQAESFARGHKYFGRFWDTQYGVVESELGQEIDLDGMVDWLE